MSGENVAIPQQVKARLSASQGETAAAREDTVAMLQHQLTEAQHAALAEHVVVTMKEAGAMVPQTEDRPTASQGGNEAAREDTVTARQNAQAQLAVSEGGTATAREGTVAYAAVQPRGSATEGEELVRALRLGVRGSANVAVEVIH